MQVLVSGGNGQLGSAIKALVPGYSSLKFRFTDLPDLDLCDGGAVNLFFRDYSPDIIINCSAYTAVDKAETEREAALKVNADAPGLLAEICKKNGSLLVHISTDYVFNGMGSRPYTETDIPDPRSYYGTTKLLGEEAITTVNCRSLIIRTAWLYSEFGSNFVKTILKRGRETEELRVVDDQVGAPTYAGDLAQAILGILTELEGIREPEIFHYANTGKTTWFEFAKTILHLKGIPCKIVPITTDELNAPAKRPLFSLLDTTRIRDRFGLTIPEWEEGLKVCLERLEP